jgi:endonuclease III-like uncharacterized protein
MLSSQTKDEVTDAAVEKLRDAVGGTLSVEAVISADDSTISNAIAKVGFWRRKTGSVYLSVEERAAIFTFSILGISRRRLYGYAMISIQRCPRR